jgi:cobalt transporter subunit CbtA
MNIFRSIVFSAVVAGFAVGAAITVIQQFGTLPLILKAEVYEKAAEHEHGSESAAMPSVSANSAGHNHAETAHVQHEHVAEAWEPSDGVERNAFTAGANVLTAIGFALILASLFAIAGGDAGQRMSWHRGLVWGLAGFVVFTIAPGLGLPPELPGVPTAPLLSRQIWWMMAALATAGGLSLIFLRQTVPAAVAGLILIILPHLIGAPELENVRTNVPTSLSHQFAITVTLTSLVFWSMLGGLTGLAFAYFDRPISGSVSNARSQAR